MGANLASTLLMNESIYRGVNLVAHTSPGVLFLVTLWDHWPYTGRPLCGDKTCTLLQRCVPIALLPYSLLLYPRSLEMIIPTMDQVCISVVDRLESCPSVCSTESWIAQPSELDVHDGFCLRTTVFVPEQNRLSHRYVSWIRWCFHSSSTKSCLPAGSSNKRAKEWTLWELNPRPFTCAKMRSENHTPW